MNSFTGIFQGFYLGFQNFSWCIYSSPPPIKFRRAHSNVRCSPLCSQHLWETLVDHNKIIVLMIYDQRNHFWVICYQNILKITEYTVIFLSIFHFLFLVIFINKSYGKVVPFGRYICVPSFTLKWFMFNWVSPYFCILNFYYLTLAFISHAILLTTFFNVGFRKTKQHKQ